MRRLSMLAGLARGTIRIRYTLRVSGGETLQIIHFLALTLNLAGCAMTFWRHRHGRRSRRAPSFRYDIVPVTPTPSTRTGQLNTTPAETPQFTVHPPAI